MIYFVQHPVTHVIKIGFSETNPQGRLGNLQVANPERLVLLLAIDGDLKDEARWHKRFADANVGGEWFEPVPELIKALLDVRRDPIRSDAESYLQDHNYHLRTSREHPGFRCEIVPSEGFEIPVRRTEIYPTQELAEREAYSWLSLQAEKDRVERQRAKEKKRAAKKREQARIAAYQARRKQQK